MARSLRTVEAPVDEDHATAVAHYRERLARPAELPWADSEWPPQLLGPSWQTTPDGYWLLPEATLGWDWLGWVSTNLRLNGSPLIYTDEQARWALWWYALDEAGRFLYRDGVLQRLKGWGKDPLGATYLAGEAFGPCRFAGWDGDHPIATDVEDAWVQTAAVAQTQTKNTFRLMPGLFTPEAVRRYRIHIGKTTIYGHGETRLIEAITSSPATLEGARATALLLNETQHWDAGNGGLDMADVIERNATKSADGAARTLAITNAPDPAKDTVALRTREAYDEAARGDAAPSGILYDSIEAAPGAPLDPEVIPDIIETVRGDSDWLDVERITASILDVRNAPSRSRRFWYNQLTASEESWADPQHWDYLARPDVLVAEGTPLALFFDGSKSDDATGLVGCRLDDGHLITLGLWQRPPGTRGDDWTVPREDVDATVEDIVERYDVRAFYADPSHALDDVTAERYWDDLVDEWHRRYRDELAIWAQPGKDGHAVNWDMTSPQRLKRFTAAAELMASDIKLSHDLPPDEARLTHDGDPRLRTHVRNARRRPNKYGVGLGKEHRESSRKVDLAVCAVGARMARRAVLNAKPRRKRGGKVW